MESNIAPPLSVSDLIGMHSSVIDFFQKKISAGRRNERYKKAQHWTEDEDSKIRAQNRQPYSIALIAHKINTILSAQRQNRSGFKVIASSDPADEIKAEIAGLLLSQKEKETGFKFLESEIFDAALSACFGALEICVKDEGGEPKVFLEKVDYHDLVWDKNARDYLLKDALFMAKRKPIYRYQAEQEYGQLPAGSDEFLRSSPAMVSYFTPGVSQQGSPYEIVNLITHYQKRSRHEFIVHFDDAANISGLSFPFQTAHQDEAEQILADAEARYRSLGLPSPHGYIEKKLTERIDKYVFTHGGILAYEETDLIDFPFCVYRSFHFEEDFWTLTDMLLAPQIFLDRIIMQIDYGFGRDVKNVFQGNINALAEGETAETAKRKAEQTGGIIWTRSHEDALRPVQQSGVNPQYFQVAILMKQFIEDLAGGRSFQGLAEHTQESGKAIQAKQQQGMLVTSLFLDNLNRWKRDAGRKMLWWIAQHETSRRFLRVAGEALSDPIKQLLLQEGLYTESRVHSGTGFISIGANIDLKKSFRDAAFELVVTEAPLLESARTEKLNQLLALHQSFPGVIPFEVFLEYLDLQSGVKEKIRASLASQSRPPSEFGIPR